MYELNTEVFKQKVIRSEDTLYRVSKSILINDRDCEDVVSSAILKAFRKKNTLREDKYFKTWLIRILINECYSIKKKQKKEVSYDEYFENTASEKKEDYSDLYLAVSKLPDKIRITLLLHYIEGYSVDETADILKIPSGTVKSRLSKGRNLLKIELGSMEVCYE